MTPARVRLRRLVRVPAVVLVSLALAELVLGFVGYGPPGHASADPVTHLYFAGAGGPAIGGDDLLNRLGFRGPAPDQLPGKALRIAAFGDSFTYGYGAALPDAWPTQLEARLQRDGVAAAVMNFGMFGYNTCQEALLVERLLPEARPDLLVLQQFANDTERQRQNPPLCGPCFSGCTWFESAGESFAYGSSLGWALFHAREGWAEWRSSVDDMLPTRALRFDPEGIHWRSYAAAAGRLAAFAKARGVPLVVAWFPDIGPDAPHGADRLTCERVRALWTSLGVPFLDLHDTLWPDTDRRWRLSDFDLHFNSAANGRIADALAVFLATHGLLSPSK